MSTKSMKIIIDNSLLIDIKCALFFIKIMKHVTNDFKHFKKVFSKQLLFI